MKKTGPKKVRIDVKINDTLVYTEVRKSNTSYEIHMGKIMQLYNRGRKANVRNS